MRACREDYPESRAALLHRGDERLAFDGILCLPVAEFLAGLHPSRRLIADDPGS